MAKRMFSATTPHDRTGNLQFSGMDLGQLQMVSRQWKGKLQADWVKIGDFRPISRYISEMVKDRDIITEEK